MTDNTMYNGFCAVHPDGRRVWYTIQRRTFNRRPYALYIDGSQSGAMNTYIKRGTLVNAVQRLALTININRPELVIEDLHGAEIVRS